MPGFSVYDERVGGTPRNVLARAVSLNLVGQLTGFAVAFASSILLARLLGASDRGLLAVMIAVTSACVAITGGGLQTAVQYFAGRRETSQAHLLGNSLVWGAGLTLVFVPGFWLLRGPVAEWFTHGRGGLVWVLAGLLVPLGFLNFVTAGQVSGRLEFGFWNAILVGSRLITLVCIAALVGVAGLGVAGAVIATGAASVFIVALCVVRFLRQGRPRFHPRLLRREMHYGLRAQLGILFSFFTSRFDVLVLGLLAPLASTGNYVVAQTLAELVIWVTMAFQISVLPLVSVFDGDVRQTETSRAAVRHHGLLSMLAISLNAIFAPFVLIVGYGQEYRSALVPLLVLLPAMWFLGTGNLVTDDLSGRGRPGLASAVKGGAAVVTVALDFALIPPFGVLGAAVASCISYAFFGGLALVALSRVSGEPLRRLVVPTREDVALYPRAARSALARLRPAVPSLQP
jgi:stage V sporulation protein B